MSFKYLSSPLEDAVSLYNIALFVHFAGLIALFSAFAIFVRGGIRLRAAQTIEQLQVAVDVLGSTRRMFPAGWILLLLSGLAMAFLRWRSPQPFIVVGLISLLALPVFGARIAGRHLQAIAAASRDVRGPIPESLARLLTKPHPWTIMTSLNAALFGVVFVMTTKPTWVIAIGVVLAATVLGALISNRLIRGESGRRPGAPDMAAAGRP